MASITNLPSSSFSSSLPDLAIEGVSEDNAVVRVYYGSVTIFSQTLWPDISGRISLLGFADMVTRHMRQRGLLQITLTVSVTPMGGSSIAKSCTTYFSTVYIGNADTFNTSRFLTMCDGPKYTNIGRAERLYSRTSSCRLSITYDDGSRQTPTVPYSQVSNGIYAYDLGRYLVLVNGHRPSHIVAVSGDRVQQYIIPSADDIDIDGLVFVNAFGLKETVYFSGVHTNKPSFKRGEIRTGRAIRQYVIEETVTHEWNTGIITLPTARLVQDLLRSYNVRRISTGEKVVITECKPDYDDADDTVVSLTVSWQLASNIQESEGASQGGIFDDTFDDSFN